MSADSVFHIAVLPGDGIGIEAMAPTSPYERGEASSRHGSIQSQTIPL